MRLSTDNGKTVGETIMLSTNITIGRGSPHSSLSLLDVLSHLECILFFSDKRIFIFHSLIHKMGFDRDYYGCHSSILSKMSRKNLALLIILISIGRYLSNGNSTDIPTK
jgi:hypothetical protein